MSVCTLLFVRYGGKTLYSFSLTIHCLVNMTIWCIIVLIMCYCCLNCIRMWILMLNNFYIKNNFFFSSLYFDRSQLQMAAWSFQRKCYAFPIEVFWGFFANFKVTGRASSDKIEVLQIERLSQIWKNIENRTVF